MARSRAKPVELCALRIFYGTLDARLIALDAETGKPCPDFAPAGPSDLSADASPLRSGAVGIKSRPRRPLQTIW